jgi:hypothetical protein
MRMRRLIRKAYRVDGGRAHIPDPYLDPPEPEVWWLDGEPPDGWRVATLCGLELRAAQVAVWGDEVCRRCTDKGSRLLEAETAAQSR